MASLKSNVLKQFCQVFSSTKLDPLRTPASKTRSLSNASSDLGQISTAESPELVKILPVCVNGTVIHGFGRGSKELGIPTANYSEEIVNNLPGSFETGIYYCWAQIVEDREETDAPKKFSQVYPAVMSIGWNPYYNNEKKSMETHVIHKFEKDWYDSQLRVMIVGRIRGETNFTSLEALIEAINTDIAQSQELLTSEWSEACKSGDFFF